MLDASAINCSATGGCSITDVAGTNFDYTVATFTAADEDGTWSFNLPDNLTGTTAVVDIFWTSDDTDCDNGDDTDVCFTLDGGGIADGEDWEVAALAGTLVSVSARCAGDGGADAELFEDTFGTFTHGMVANDRAIVQLARDNDGTDGTGCNAAADDDYTGNAQVLAVKFCYEVDNVFSGE
jgi:hypothetical protein